MKRRLFSVLLVAALSACQPKLTPMTEQQAQQMKQMTDQMTPRCVGRYLIDLPRDFVINPVARTVIEDVTIEIEPMEQKTFATRLLQRRAQLQQDKIFGKDTPSLAAEIALQDGNGVVFNRSETQESPVLRTLELVAWHSGFHISMQLNATDGTSLVVDPKAIGTVFEQSERNRVEQYRSVNTVPQKLAHLLNVYSRTRGRADHEIPTTAGVCLPHGFVSGPATDEEWLDMHYHLASAEDVYFTFRSLSHIGSDGTTLLDRGSAIEKALSGNDGKTLRKGKGTSNGLSFEEWLGEQQSRHGSRFYDFTLELNGKEGNAQKPLFITEFSSGVRIPDPKERTLEEVAVLKPILTATLGEAESVALWDVVTRTLRARSGAF